MKYHLLICSVLFLVSQLFCQVSITFQLDMKELTEKGLFNYDADNQVFIRGSFNNWSGNDFELSKSNIPGLLIGKFKLGAIGDTISYKFVIKKDKNHIFWESSPNPSNNDYGNRQLIIDKQDIVLPPVQFDYDEYFSYPVKFSKDKLKEDFLQFRNILESTHPALYDYTKKEALDSVFDSNFKRINSDMEFREFLISMTEVISKVGCGHSSLWVPEKYWYVAPPKLFPLKLYVYENKMYVSGSCNNSQVIPLGSELLSINGQSVQTIIKRLSALISADGFNPSYRRTKVAQNFAIKYAYANGFPDNFIIEYIKPGTHNKKQKTISPVSKEAVDKNKPILSELSFKEIEKMNAGLLTINTFAYYSQVPMFHNFIDSVFQEIKNNNIENLILDLRGNSGGDPFCASYLWSYFQPEALPYFEDHYGKYDTLANPIPQPANNFKGKLFTLIDGNGFSTTGHFCGLLKYHKVGKFIGSELGATYTCTGNATYPPLKNTGIMVGTARVRRYTAAVKDMDPMRGVMPDYPVEPTPQDIIKGRDAVMKFAFSLITSK